MTRIRERNSAMAVEMLDVETFETKEMKEMLKMIDSNKMKQALAKILEEFNRLALARGIDFTVSGDVEGMVRLSTDLKVGTKNANGANSVSSIKIEKIKKLIIEVFSAGMKCTSRGGSVELEFAISDYIRFALHCSGYCDGGVFKGLAGMVEEMKGTLFVESRDLGGTGIHVCIPCDTNQGYVL